MSSSEWLNITNLFKLLTLLTYFAITAITAERIGNLSNTSEISLEHFTKLHYTLRFMQLKWFKEELFSFKWSLMRMPWPSMNYHTEGITCDCVLSWWAINFVFHSCAGFLGLGKFLPTLERFFSFLWHSSWLLLIPSATGTFKLHLLWDKWKLEVDFRFTQEYLYHPILYLNYFHHVVNRVCHFASCPPRHE